MTQLSSSSHRSSPALRSAVRAIAVVTALCSAFLVAPREAHAAKIPVVIYQNGDDIFVAGDGKLPAPFDTIPDLQGAQAGYKCKVFGVFWAMFSVSDCKPVAFRDDTYWDDSELVAAVAKAHPESEMQMGVWQAYGKFPLGLIGLALIGAFIWSKVSSKDED